MSVGHLLNNGLELEGSSSSLEFSARTSSMKWPLLKFKPYFLAKIFIGLVLD
jgi:hypothetical protein